MSDPLKDLEGIGSPYTGNAQFEGVQPDVMDSFNQMSSDYFNATGKQLKVNDAFRSRQAQAEAYKNKPGLAAKPGHSLHEKGQAFDIDESQAHELDQMGLLKNYGFERPMMSKAAGKKYEPWHIQAVDYSKKAGAIAASIPNPLDELNAIGGGVATAPAGKDIDFTKLTDEELEKAGKKEEEQSTLGKLWEGAKEAVLGTSDKAAGPPPAAAAEFPPKPATSPADEVIAQGEKMLLVDPGGAPVVGRKKGLIDLAMKAAGAIPPIPGMSAPATEDAVKSFLDSSYEQRAAEVGQTLTKQLFPEGIPAPEGLGRELAEDVFGLWPAFLLMSSAGGMGETAAQAAAPIIGPVLGRIVGSGVPWAAYGALEKNPVLGAAKGQVFGSALGGLKAGANILPIPDVKVLGKTIPANISKWFAAITGASGLGAGAALLEGGNWHDALKASVLFAGFEMFGPPGEAAKVAEWAKERGMSREIVDNLEDPVTAEAVTEKYKEFRNADVDADLAKWVNRVTGRMELPTEEQIVETLRKSKGAEKTPEQLGMELAELDNILRTRYPDTKLEPTITPGEPGLRGRDVITGEARPVIPVEGVGRPREEAVPHITAPETEYPGGRVPGTEPAENKILEMDFMEKHKAVSKWYDKISRERGADAADEALRIYLSEKGKDEAKIDIADAKRKQLAEVKFLGSGGPDTAAWLKRKLEREERSSKDLVRAIKPDTVLPRVARTFDMNTTDMPWYDNLLENPEYFAKNKGVTGKVVYMTPDEYIRECGMNRGRNKLSYEQEMQAVDPTLVDRYKEATEAGSRMPMPVLDRANNEQEGRHRALVAKALGLNAIPVLVVDKANPMFSGGPDTTEWFKSLFDKDVKINPLTTTTDKTLAAATHGKELEKIDIPQTRVFKAVADELTGGQARRPGKDVVSFPADPPIPTRELRPADVGQLNRDIGFFEREFMSNNITAANAFKGHDNPVNEFFDGQLKYYDRRSRHETVLNNIMRTNGLEADVKESSKAVSEKLTPLLDEWVDLHQKELQMQDEIHGLELQRNRFEPGSDIAKTFDAKIKALKKLAEKESKVSEDAKADVYRRRAAVLDDLIEKHPNVRIKMAGEGNKKALELLRPNEVKIMNETKKYLDAKKAEMKRLGMPVIEEDYVPHIFQFGSDPNDRGAGTYAQGLWYGRRKLQPSMLEFIARTPGSKDWFPLWYQSMKQYIPSVERKLAFNPYLNKWMPVARSWQSKYPGAWKWFADFHEKNFGVEDQKTVDKAINGLVNLEYARTLALNLSPPVLHLFKLFQTPAWHGFGPSAKGLYRFGKGIAQKVLDMQGPERQVLELYLRMPDLIRSVEQAPGMDRALSPEYWRRMLQQAGYTGRKLGTFMTTLIEYFDNGVNLMSAIESGAAAGAPARLIHKETLDSLMRLNFRGFNMPKVMTGTAGRAGFMYWGQPTKLLENKADLLFKSLTGKRDVYGRLYLNKAIRLAALLGGMYAAGQMANVDLSRHVLHPPGLAPSKDTGEYTINFQTPPVQLAGQIAEKGVLPALWQHFTQIPALDRYIQMKDDQVSSKFEDEWMQTLGLPRVDWHEELINRKKLLQMREDKRHPGKKRRMKSPTQRMLEDAWADMTE